MGGDALDGGGRGFAVDGLFEDVEGGLVDEDLLELDVVRCNWKCSTRVGLLGHVTNYFSFSRPTARMNDLRVFFHPQSAVRGSRLRAARPIC